VLRACRNGWLPVHLVKLPNIFVDFPFSSLSSPLLLLEDAVTSTAGIQLYIKRDDLIHPYISGNKWRKMKYALLDAKDKGYTTLLTFGGSHSNHLYATAAAGALMGLRTIGVVRGEEYTHKTTATLTFCREQGMQLYPVSRSDYRQKNLPVVIESLRTTFGDPYILPEGGTSLLALPGVREMVKETETQLGFVPNYYLVPAGTGGTAAGILSADRSVVAFSALKGGDFLKEDILNLCGDPEAGERLTLMTQYHFGGYARHTPALLHWMYDFEQQHKILLEQVYTAKMFYGLYDLLKNGYFKEGSRLVAVHTGGLQGRLN
jgi:1-aminocyclopropane-1-carboxylate deaminase